LIRILKNGYGSDLFKSLRAAHAAPSPGLLIAFCLQVAINWLVDSVAAVRFLLSTSPLGRSA